MDPANGKSKSPPMQTEYERPLPDPVAAFEIGVIVAAIAALGLSVRLLCFGNIPGLLG